MRFVEDLGSTARFNRIDTFEGSSQDTDIIGSTLRPYSSSSSEPENEPDQKLDHAWTNSIRNNSSNPISLLKLFMNLLWVSKSE